jgi:2,4-dienoyl-CoA reductase-like NADH-dependent reductase (Old Yellow Enzyme family)
MDTDVSTARPLLFSPLTIRGVTLPNRTVLAPMVQYRALGGVPTDFHMVHLGKFALGRFGTVMTEATAVEARGRVGHGCPGIWHDDQIPAWRRITDYIRREGSVPAMQLAHSGRKGATHRALDGTVPYNEQDAANGLPPWPVVGPTTEPPGAGYQIPHQLRAEEIAGVTRSFADGARRADAARFDVIEIHGAHGYLLATFLSAISNTRNDAYGGDRAGRMRFPLEVARAVRAVWPAHKPLFFRLSSEDGAGGWTIEDTVVFAQALKAVGVDVVDCSSGGLTGSAVTAPIPR